MHEIVSFSQNARFSNWFPIIELAQEQFGVTEKGDLSQSLLELDEQVNHALCTDELLKQLIMHCLNSERKQPVNSFTTDDVEELLDHTSKERKKKRKRRQRKKMGEKS